MGREDITPYGYDADADGGLAQNVKEQEALHRLMELSASGASYGAIARTLTVEGRLPRGNAWYPGTVRRIVLREKTRPIHTTGG